MHLSELIAGLGERGRWGEDPAIARVTSDSREVVPGTLFVCVRGEAADGHDYAAQAVERGAVAVVAEREVPTAGVPLVLVPSTRQALAELALRLHGNPERELSLVGITGTNGKTTVSFLLTAIFAAAGRRLGTIGTVGAFAGAERLRGPGLTTPGPATLAPLLREMVAKGCDGAVLEVSSHALEQQRVAGLRFSPAAFTNLSRDHLDYHPDMEAYFQAKARLFSEGLGPDGVAVVNGDDLWASRLPLPERTWRFSTRDPKQEIFGDLLRADLGGLELRVHTPAGTLHLRSPLIGAYNAENLLCATGLALSLGVEPQAIEEGLASSPGAPGRMERVEGDVPVFVDFAHTDDALRRAVGALRDAGAQRLWVVFGCGGDRDRGKRPLMGRAAAVADQVVVTSDNPRTEDPAAIAAEIVQGLEAAGKKEYVVELDRRRAIHLAIEGAGANDAVLIAGKGHEDHQIVGTEARPFDDRDEARRALAGMTTR